MQGLKIPHLIGIAALCWLALIFFQVNWIKDSRDLIEEQFDQKVSLALGAAIGSLDSATVQECCAEVTVCKQPGENLQGENFQSEELAGTEVLNPEAQDEVLPDQELLVAELADQGLSSSDFTETESETLSQSNTDLTESELSEVKPRNFLGGLGLGNVSSNNTIAVAVNPAILSAVDEALSFYDIDLAYHVTIEREPTPSCNPTSPYCCEINPFIAADKATMNITFPGKSAYLFKKIWWMLASSVFILLFILLVFVLALRSLIFQKRISQWNIDFFNNMAHEFKTPLTNIRLATQRLVKKNPALANDPYINVVRNEDAKLGEQIDRVLNMATLGSGSPYLKPQTLNLQRVIHNVVDEMHLQIHATNATVTIHPSEDNYQVEGDIFHLSNAFRNLIDNALKYNNKLPVIDIHFERRGENIAMTFNDNGIGIARKNRELVFNKFHRVPHGNRHDRKGFGLGLSYVKMIIEDHHGSIKALNKAHEGSKFELILPAA